MTPKTTATAAKAATATTLPAGFEHDALKSLLAQGTTKGYVELAQVRAGLEAAGVSTVTAQKKVLRVFNDQAIEVRDDGTSKAAPAKKTAAKTTAAKAAPA
ncbi:MAG: RNA polymerase sigma factor region1.1 domain-containing protein, partial [Ornithinimicrobium sp.]